MLAMTVGSICRLQGIRWDSMPSLAATSWSCRFGFEEFEKTPRTLVCEPSFRVRDMFRMTASAPYIPPLLMMCRIFTGGSFPHVGICLFAIQKSPNFFVQPVSQQRLRGCFHLILPLQAGQKVTAGLKKFCDPFQRHVASDVEPADG